MAGYFSKEFEKYRIADIKSERKEKRKVKVRKFLKDIDPGDFKRTKKFSKIGRGSYATGRRIAAGLQSSQKSKAKARAHELKILKLKHQQRLAQIKAQGTIQQDPRFQDDGFMSSPIQETNIQPIPDLNAYSERMKRNYLGDFGRGLSRLAQRFAPQRQPLVNRKTLPRNIQAELRRRENILNTPATILNAPNIFNKAGESIQSRSINLMQQLPPAPKLNFWRAP